MDIKLDQELCEKYPKLFVNRHAPMTVTAMCWGFDHEDGWFDLIDTLCRNIQHHIDWQNRTEEKVRQVVVDQVKEKFGTLRFYYTGGDDTISGMVTMAESMSGHICEVCGSKGRMRNNGWIRTLCDTHAKEMGYE